MTELTVSGRFDIDIAPAGALLPNTGRFDFTKTWTGGIEGASAGVMLSAGDPASGTAGYVAIEAFEGSIDGRTGTITFQQLGSMVDGTEALRYEIVPGSGTGDLTTATGELVLDVADGDHSVVLRLRLA
ncbi:DUF3224 domain-containing protein [Agromyces atrinae]|uniref:DUF3224 domain-containing protein n=1 Tax=Agromyces atrinae TaxID=592376 RepID=UPI001F5A6D1D|nr:DUF3224 domain-containing protein [Agromyces atrinae]MCI2957836.1 DUF3224 domain-containing protein [Agromyces atrinae]